MPSGAWPGHLFAKVFDHLGLYDQEIDCYRWEMDESINAPSPHRMVWALGELGRWYSEHGHRELARMFLEAEVELASVAADPYSEAVALNDLAFVYKRMRQLDVARDHFESSLVACAGLNYTKHEAIVHNNLGLLYLEQGEYERAVTAFESSLHLSTEDYVTIRSIATANLGLAHIHLNRIETGLEFLEQALTINKAIGDVGGMGNVLRNLGQVYNSRGNFAQAHVYLSQAVMFLRQTTDIQELINTLELLGDCNIALGKNSEALSIYEEAVQLTNSVKDSVIYNWYIYNDLVSKIKRLKKN